MCLILFSLKTHPRYKFILAANRDEFFERPCLTADFWKSDKNILGGIDLVSRGTWLGITKNGRFAAITNYRDPQKQVEDPISRGDITRQFLESTLNCQTFLSGIAIQKDRYNGFNLLLSDNGLHNLYYYSNLTDTSATVANGLHGLSNAFLDTPWPKVDLGVSLLSKTIASSDFGIDELLSIMTDRRIAPDASLPNTGISLELEKKLSPVFISMNGYGTRCSTAILLDYEDNLEFLEVSYDDSARPTISKRYQIKIARHK